MEGEHFHVDIASMYYQWVAKREEEAMVLPYNDPSFV